MEKQPIFVAQQVGHAFRGEVLDGRDYHTVLVTAHTYANETIAKVAAQRMWAERQQPQQVAA